jgi:hypothetical protein
MVQVMFEAVRRCSTETRWNRVLTPMQFTARGRCGTLDNAGLELSHAISYDRMRGASVIDTEHRNYIMEYYTKDMM